MDLKKKVLSARSKVLKLEPKYKEVKKHYDKAVSVWKDAVKELEAYDYEQSIVDGRTKKVPIGQGKPKKLTDKQKLEILEKLGL